MVKLDIELKYLSLLISLFIMPAHLFAGEYLHVITENWKPYNYEENGEIKGDSSENVIKVLERAGIDYGINVYPWSRVYKMGLNNKNTLIYTLVRMPVREPLFNWARPILDTEFSSLYRLKARSDVQVSSLNEAIKYKIGVIKDSMNYYYFLSRGFNDVLVPVSTDHTQNVIDLLQGDVELMASSDKHFSYAVKKIGVSEALFEKVWPLFEIHPYMAFSHDTSQELVDRVNRAYDELVEEGAIKRFE